MDNKGEQKSQKKKRLELIIGLLMLLVLVGAIINVVSLVMGVIPTSLIPIPI
ncbi:MAG: hypothetical protein JXB14_01245 [Candidatus Altiarchaeota archaeon]|nr:hypothetical protein [Candidatus Altiarchaeota archaeon]